MEPNPPPSRRFIDPLNSAVWFAMDALWIVCLEWPAYAAHGKQATTVRHVLAHQAGLPAFPEAAMDIAFDDRDALVQLLADATPVHEPGAACADHALTYGHLCDQLVRLATGEDLADRFARIAARHGWDLHLSVAKGDLGRVADPVAVAYERVDHSRCHRFRF